jgi:hypothetical protein
MASADVQGGKLLSILQILLGKGLIEPSAMRHTGCGQLTVIGQELAFASNVHGHPQRLARYSASLRIRPIWRVLASAGRQESTIRRAVSRAITQCIFPRTQRHTHELPSTLHRRSSFRRLVGTGRLQR